jgi:hypothetical protein
MIGDCIQLVNGARLVRACIEEPGRGVALARYKNQWAVWRIFRGKNATKWNCTDGHYFGDKASAEATFVEMVDEFLPEVSCPECGYYFDDMDEGCDACASRKQILSASVGGA